MSNEHSNGHGNGHRPEQSNGGAPPMSAEQFGGYMEKRLTVFDTIQVIDRAGMELRLRANDADVTADLSTFYSAYLRDPSQLDVVVETFVRVMLGMQPDRSTNDYAALADQIFPMLKPLEMLVEVRERRLPMLAYREFLGDLMITYVIDEERSVAYINEEHLERWSVSVQDLHERAIENLRQRTDVGRECAAFLRDGTGGGNLPPTAGEMRSAAEAASRYGIGDIAESQSGEVVVTEVKNPSPAYRAGLRPNHVIVQVGDTKVTTMQEFFSALAEHGLHQGRDVKFTTKTAEGDSREYTITTR